jgi:hypothetical protein
MWFTTPGMKLTDFGLAKLTNLLATPRISKPVRRPGRGVVMWRGAGGVISGLQACENESDE